MQKLWFNRDRLHRQERKRLSALLQRPISAYICFYLVRKKETPDVSVVLDPTLPSIDAICPECGHKGATYFLTEDQAETKMLARLVCKNVSGSTIKCGHIWILNDESEITDQTVKVKEEDDENINEEFLKWK